MFRIISFTLCFNYYLLSSLFLTSSCKYLLVLSNFLTLIIIAHSFIRLLAIML